VTCRPTYIHSPCRITVLGWSSRADAKPKFATALPHPFERLRANATA
jgi:hypothetical protein